MRRSIAFDSNETYKNPYTISALASNYPSYYGDNKLLHNIDTGKDEFGYNDELIIQIHKIKAKNSVGAIKEGQCFYSIAFDFSKKHSQVYISKNIN